MTNKISAARNPSSGNRVSRRGLLAAAGLGAATSLTGNFTIFSREAQASVPLRVLSWPGYEERDVVDEFEDRFKTRVVFKTYIGGEQMLQFLAQTPAGTFDAIIADAEYVPNLKANEAISAYKTADFPELSSYHPKFRNFAPTRGETDGTVYGIPTRFSFYGISYNTDAMGEDEATDWMSLLNPKYAGRVGVFDWYLPNLGNASLAINPGNPTPYSINDEQLAKAREFLIKLRPQVGMFGSSSQPLIQAMLAGDIVVSPAGDLDIDLKLAGYENFASTIPKQGAVRWQEVACISSTSKNRDLALEWIRYMTSPKIQSQLVYGRAFKARGPNMKIVDYWSDDQKKLLSYVPDPSNPGKMLVETLIDRSMPRGLPTSQSVQTWINIFNEFKTA